jgi:hypothetical protein
VQVSNIERIVKPVETAIAKQWLRKRDATAATLMYAAIEEVFSVWSTATALANYNKATARNVFCAVRPDAISGEQKPGSEVWW